MYNLADELFTAANALHWLGKYNESNALILMARLMRAKNINSIIDATSWVEEIEGVDKDSLRRLARNAGCGALKGRVPSAQHEIACAQAEKAEATLEARHMQLAEAVGHVYEADGRASAPEDWEPLIEHVRWLEKHNNENHESLVYALGLTGSFDGTWETLCRRVEVMRGERDAASKGHEKAESMRAAAERTAEERRERAKAAERELAEARKELDGRASTIKAQMIELDASTTHMLRIAAERDSARRALEAHGAFARDVRTTRDVVRRGLPHPLDVDLSMLDKALASLPAATPAKTCETCLHEPGCGDAGETTLRSSIEECWRAKPSAADGAGRPILRREPVEPFKIPVADCEPIVDTIARQAAVERVIEAAKVVYADAREANLTVHTTATAATHWTEFCKALRALSQPGSSQPERKGS